eukprot:7274405-Lingulodinium_polyedra.AAC.1
MLLASPGPPGREPRPRAPRRRPARGWGRPQGRCRGGASTSVPWQARFQGSPPAGPEGADGSRRPQTRTGTQSRAGLTDC